MTNAPQNSPPPDGSSGESISAADYQIVRSLLRKESGIDLGVDRQYLVMNRLTPIATQFDCQDVTALVARLQRTQDRHLIEAIVESMTINETSFFRGGPKTFDALVDVMIPALHRTRAAHRRLRIWSGACATGQEPFSILMTLQERCPQLRDWDVQVIATDISERALQQGRSGSFNQFEVQRGLSVQLLLKYFTQTGDRWQIAESVRGRVTFRRHNLLDSFLPLGPPLDIVFLRNVLIYFELETKRQLFQRLRQCIASDGFLVLGESETTLGITNDFQLNETCRECYLPAK